MKEDTPTPSFWRGLVEPCALCQADLTPSPTGGDSNLRHSRGRELVGTACIQSRSLRSGHDEGPLLQGRPSQKPIAIAGQRRSDDPGARLRTTYTVGRTRDHTRNRLRIQFIAPAPAVPRRRRI